VKFSAASRLKKNSGGGYGIQTSAAARRKMLYQNNGLLWRRTISQSGGLGVLEEDREMTN